MTWAKGQSGNPGGRPRNETGEVRDLARAYTVDAIKTLVKSLKAKSERTKVAAAEALLNRGWGMPKADIDLTVKSPIDELTAEQRDALRAVLSGATLGDPGGAGQAGPDGPPEPLPPLH